VPFEASVSKESYIECMKGMKGNYKTNNTGCPVLQGKTGVLAIILYGGAGVSIGRTFEITFSITI